MKQAYTKKKQAIYRCLVSVLFGVFPFLVLAGANQSSVFNTVQGFLPRDYLTMPPAHAYPQPLRSSQVPAQCQSPSATDDFQLSGSVLESFQDGLGVVYQAMFNPKLEINSGTNPVLDSVYWVGDLRAILIDEAGRLRSDNGDKKLGSLQDDPLVDSCFDPIAGIRRFRLSRSAKFGTASSCNALHYAYADKDIGYLWRASDELAAMSETEAAMQRKPFNDASKRRFIRTHIGQQEYDFVATADYPFEAPWFGTKDVLQAEALIHYVRGQAQPALRERYRDQQAFRLGDTRQNLPVHVGKPSANFHLLYGDESYGDFVNQYRTRRSRIFLSTHDGMLHAFNAGWYDPDSKQIKSKTQASTRAGLTDWSLGQELWAFVPFDLLPMLSEQAKKSYGRDLRHLNLLNQAPYVFDARIFNSQGMPQGLDGQADRIFSSADGSVVSRRTHPGGWGTVMLLGFGYGGGVFSVEDAQGIEHRFKPSYLLFDITDAEQAPRLLAAIQHEDLGSTLSLPSAFTVKNQQGDLEWHLALGSGADPDPKGMQSLSSSQSAKLFLLRLRTLQRDLQAGKVQPIHLAATGSYVGGISAADWNMDGETDALYLSTVRLQQNSTQTNWKGDLFRVITARANRYAQGGRAEKLLSLHAPLPYRPQLSIDPQKNRWIYLASGRLAQSHDFLMPAQNSIVGLKETRLSSGAFLMDGAVGKAGQRVLNLQKLLNVTALRVDSQSGELHGSLSLSPALARQHVLDLEQRLMQYGDAAAYQHGWHRVLARNEVASAQAILYGGILSQPSYQTDSISCSINGHKSAQISGQAFVHQLRFTTGTAWFDTRGAQTQTKPGTKKPSATLNNTKSGALGASTLTGFLVQTLSNPANANILLTDQDKLVKIPEQDFLEYLISGEISWREL